MKFSFGVCLFVILCLKYIQGVPDPSWYRYRDYISQEYEYTTAEPDSDGADDQIDVRSSHIDENTLWRWFDTLYRPSYANCECVDFNQCPLTHGIFKKQPYPKDEVNLMRRFTCGYIGFRPSICCNLYTTYVLFRKHKQKRAYGYSGHRKPAQKFDHHFRWDSLGFPHWNHAPSDYNRPAWNANKDPDCEPNHNYYPNYYPNYDPNYFPNFPPPRGYTTTTLRPDPTVPVQVDVITTSTTEIPVTTIQPADVPITLSREEKITRLSSQVCGTTVGNRIVGGEDARLGDYPWMARLGYIRSGSSNIMYRCGGTLISDRYVLTAAHCVNNLPMNLEFTQIRLGELDETTEVDCNGNECADPPQDFTPENVIFHPNYNSPRLSNDIALIRLNTPVRMTAYVSPLCLPFDGTPEGIQNLTGTQAIVAGWGATNTGVTAGSPTLKWVRLNIINTEQCISTYRTRFNITVSSGQLCTGGVENMDACEGDSGGPLFVEAQDGHRAALLGIVSFGPRRCGTAALPGVYTRVQNYLDWILDSMQLV